MSKTNLLCLAVFFTLFFVKCEVFLEFRGECPFNSIPDTLLAGNTSRYLGLEITDVYRSIREACSGAINNARSVILEDEN